MMSQTTQLRKSWRGLDADVWPEFVGIDLRRAIQSDGEIAEYFEDAELLIELHRRSFESSDRLVKRARDAMGASPAA
jgi:hypothetical protein